MTTRPPAAVREPKQARSRDSWERALEAGLELLKEGGVEALTITEVCRRAAISPPSLYARVDGLTGLFFAVWERGMEDVRGAEDRAFAGLPRTEAASEERATDAAAALAEVFERNAAFLRPVIGQAGTDRYLLRLGALESRRLLARVVAALDVAPALGQDIARALYAECVLRTMYGPDFFDEEPESATTFTARIARTAATRMP
ncbi:MAG TPA: TetR/AcrR family transcriptional regulator [Amnibacterium sp.]|nr:TetR/AcrR family transcriptional regulator [Amnibacterium sp.]